MDNVFKFPGKKRHLRVIKSAEMYSMPQPSDLMIWEVCPYIKSGGDNADGCYECPAYEPDSEGGFFTRSCRALAMEACRIMMAIRKRETDIHHYHKTEEENTDGKG